MHIGVCIGGVGGYVCVCTCVWAWGACMYKYVWRSEDNLV